MKLCTCSICKILGKDAGLVLYKEAGKIPGIPDGTGPGKDSPKCPCKKDKEDVSSKPMRRRLRQGQPDDKEAAIVEKREEKSEVHKDVLIPIIVQELKSGTRVIVNMSDIAAILEKKYNGESKKTEIQMGEGNEVIFDLELKA